MNIKKIAMALTMAAGLSVTTSAMAAGTYAGISFGQSTTKDWFSEQEAADLFAYAVGSYPTSGEVEDTDTALKIYFGINATENIDFRLGYTNLGEATADGSNSTASLGISVENQGVFADVLAKFKPAERIALYGKLGVAFMKTEMSITARGPGGYAEQTMEGNSLVFIPGLGLAVNVTDSVALALEYERYLDVGDEEETGQSDVDVISAGITIGF